MPRKTAVAKAPKFTTREEWLVAATAAIAPLFVEVGETVPAIRVSVGWPGGRGRKNSVIGQCWPTSLAGDKVAQVFISPVLGDVPQVLAVLVHEIVHAVDDCQSGHKGRFGKIARAIGLEGKLTATTAGEALAEKLKAIAADLGAFPHGVLASTADGVEGPAKQGTRMLKVECAEGSGYKVRMTRQWIEDLGTPSCPCHGDPMIEG